jgi:hypothetical protein
MVPLAFGKGMEKLRHSAERAMLSGPTEVQLKPFSL